MGVAQEDGSDVQCGILAEGKVGGNEIRPIDVEFWEEVEVYEIVNTTSVTALEEFFVKQSVFAEVLAKIQEDSLAVFLQIDLVSTDAVCTVIDGKRYQ